MTGDRSDALLLRPSEVAELLSLSRSTVYNLIARGELPGVVRLGGASVRIHRGVLEDWLARQATDTKRVTP